MLIGSIAQRELSEIALKIIVASDGPVCCDNQELLLFRPANTFDGCLVPIQTTNKFSRTAIQVDT